MPPSPPLPYAAGRWPRRALAEGAAVARALADLVLPAACAGCALTGPSAAPLCRECAAALEGRPRVSWPSPPPPGLPEPWAAAPYDAAVRGALTAHKEEGRRALARPLGQALGRSLAAALASTGGDGAVVGPAATQAVLVVPVPSTASARRRRGGDPLLRLVQHALVARPVAAVGAGGVPGTRLARVLVQTRRLADQAGLGTAQRRANLAGALAVAPWARTWLSGAQVVLVDDVVTTGATLAEAARALRAVGAAVDGAAVVAATRRRGVPGAPTTGLSR